MATNKKPVKIQDVIDNINNEWGEEHKKELKKIFNSNVILTPLIFFVFLSFVYLFPLILSFPWLFSTPGKYEYFPIKILELWFNSPYYIFDIRASIIVSVVSILLSLYVSVGKFADGAEGVTGEARRAAYRKFARIVGGIIFSAFTLNFWYGLIAGYFQGGVSVPYPFKPWVVSPEMGASIVPGEVNLSRYGEMPLWVLLFFAWFTLASALMLTYNEKDILIKSMYALRTIENIKNDKKSYYVREYKLAENEIYSGVGLLRLSSENQIERYSDLFSRKVNSVDFSFKFERKKIKYILIPSICTLVCSAILFIWFKQEGALLGLLVSFSEVVGWLVTLGSWTARSIMRVDSFGLRFWLGRFLLNMCFWVTDNLSNIVYLVTIYISIFLVFQQQANLVICFIVLVSFLTGSISRKIVVYNFKRSLKYNSKIFLIYTHLGVSGIRLNEEDLYFSDVGVYEWLRYVIWARIKFVVSTLCNIKFISSTLCNFVKNLKNNPRLWKKHWGEFVDTLHLRSGEMDYVALAYTYFIMVRVNEYYMEYESLTRKSTKETEGESSAYFFLKLYF